VSILSCHSRGTNHTEAGTVYTFASRVLEKSAHYAVALLEAICARLDFNGVKRLLIWSDTGPSFRAQRFLATIACHFTFVHKLPIVLLYHLEHHGKTSVDGYFGKLSRWAYDGSMRGTLNDIDSLVSCWQQQAAAQVAEATSPRPVEVFVNFVPPPKKDVSIYAIKNGELPCSMRASHCWSCTPHDERRSSYFGRGRQASKLTGVFVRSHGLPDTQAPATHCCQPEIDFDCLEVPDEELAAYETDMLTWSTRDFNGWRTSYTACDVTLPNPEKNAERLRKKRDSMLSLVSKVPIGKRHMQHVLEG
jgi:hypothetical protein